MNLQVSERIKDLRRLKSITQQKMAEIGGKTVQTQQNYERGRSTPDIAYLQRLADAGFDVVYLLTGDKNATLIDKENQDMLSLLQSAGADMRKAAAAMLMRAANEPTVFIPKLASIGSMGNGINGDLSHDDIVEYVPLNEYWLRNEFKTMTSISNLRLVTGKGDSMKDTFDDGDVLFADIGVHDYDCDAIYQLELNGDIYIKRLQKLPNGHYKMISDNKKYGSYELDERNQLRIIAKILGAWCFTRF